MVVVAESCEQWQEEANHCCKSIPHLQFRMSLPAGLGIAVRGRMVVVAGGLVLFLHRMHRNVPKVNTSISRVQHSSGNEAVKLRGVSKRGNVQKCPSTEKKQHAGPPLGGLAFHAVAAD